MLSFSLDYKMLLRRPLSLCRSPASPLSDGMPAHDHAWRWHRPRALPWNRMYMYVRVYMYSMFKLSFYISLKHIKNIQIIHDHIDLLPGKDRKRDPNIAIFSSPSFTAPSTLWYCVFPGDPARLDREIIGVQVCNDFMGIYWIQCIWSLNTIY